jgi:serine/threonine-protein kinase
VRRHTRIGKYELTDTIGHGSFGIVYAARDIELDREVALKILNPSRHGDGFAMQRFLREARAAARIAHPGIVTVYDCGRYASSEGPQGSSAGISARINAESADSAETDEDEELAYIAMERLSGESLTRRLNRVGRMRPEDAAEVVRQVAAALDAAHHADVLHRDLKPDNIYLVPDPAAPSGERVKVLDFGLAKLGASRLTLLGTVFGTPLYMSPEQCRSATDIDARSDIYALGCILFELLTGRAPFEGPIYAVTERHMRERAPSVASVAPEIPPALVVLVAAMLEKDPADRPQTMAEVVRTIEDVFAARGAGSGADRAAERAVATLRAATARRARAEAARETTAADAAARRPMFATYASARSSTWWRRGTLALLAAIALALALAGALSVMAAQRRGGAPADVKPAGQARLSAGVGGMTPAP